MAQLFRPGANAVAGAVIAAIVLVPVAAVGLTYAYWQSPYATRQYMVPRQPVPFSHEHHAGRLGLDCRYCHTSVEKAAFAGMPATHTCMTCHSQIWTRAPMLAPVRASLFNNLGNIPATTFQCPADEEGKAKLALELDLAMREKAPAGWKGDEIREKQVLNALFPIMSRDRQATQAIFDIVKNQHNY